MNRSEAHAILANADREHVVRELIEEDGLSTIEDLSQQIASNGQPLKQAKISLVHNHLPRLEDHGVIEYDQRNGDIVLTNTGETLKPLLYAAEELESSSPERGAKHYNS